MFLKYIFYKAHNVPPKCGLMIKISIVSENEKLENLNNMGIHWTGLNTRIQNNVQNWKIFKVGDGKKLFFSK